MIVTRYKQLLFTMIDHICEKKMFFCELCDCTNLLYNNGQPLYTPPPDRNLKNAQFTSTIKNKPPVIEY